MQCPVCVDTAVTSFCRECGRGTCGNCSEMRNGIPYCLDCAANVVDATASSEQSALPKARPPVALPAPPPSAAAAADGPHPFLAGLLGFVPGLGAVYNGQYVKGVIHTAIFGLLIAISTSSEEEAIHALLVPMTVFFVLYMPIEAVRTAQAIRRGERVEEMSGIVGVLLAAKSDSPLPGILFITLGVFFFLFTLGVFEVEVVLNAWPLIFVALGAWHLYSAIRRRDAPAPPHRTPEAAPLDQAE